MKKTLNIDTQKLGLKLNTEISVSVDFFSLVFVTAFNLNIFHEFCHFYSTLDLVYRGDFSSNAFYHCSTHDTDVCRCLSL